VNFEADLFRNTPLMTPRTECACHPVSAIICASVPPAGALNSVMRRDCLLDCSVGAADFVAGRGLTAEPVGEGRCCRALAAAVAFLRGSCCTATTGVLPSGVRLRDADFADMSAPKQSATPIAAVSQ
jgi:hypothetical protein